MAGNCGVLSPQPGEWVKGKMIGSGSFGSVHLAMNKSNGSLFVVKSAESRAGVQSLENEAEILESLNSPYVVQYIGRDVWHPANGERKIDLFIEYMAGGSLADVAEKFGGKLDEAVIRLYTKEILRGLKYLHKNGIVHCDLKCKNVLLGSCGDIKLADFGCSRKVNDSKISNLSEKSCMPICGTPLWMAPEVLRNEGLDFSADIWSLGCTVIEMATGIPPWSERGISNPVAAVLRIASGNERPQYPRHFSKNGLDFLDKCLDRNPKRRSTIEELLNHPFVSGKSDEINFGKETVFSPASVLDFGTCEDDDYESEEEESPEEINVTGRIPFSIRYCGGERKRRSQISCERSMLVSSENWVTVRTG